MKNRYRLKNTTMQKVKKKSIPIDEERILSDLLRNQHLFRVEMNKEIPNYTPMRENF